MEFPFKKRQRIPASCSVCRKRKSKCDRVKPICGSCKKKSIAHLCYYESEKAEVSPGESGGLAYVPMGGQVKMDSPGEPSQPGHRYPSIGGVPGPYRMGSNGKVDSPEGVIPSVPSYGGSGNAPNMTDRMYHPGGPQMHQQHSHLQNPHLQVNMHGKHQMQQAYPQLHHIQQGTQQFPPSIPHPMQQGEQLHPPPPPPPPQLQPLQKQYEQLPRSEQVQNRPLNYSTPPQFNPNNGVPPFPIANINHEPLNSFIADELKVQDGDISEKGGTEISPENLVLVTIGPNSTLKVNPLDTIDVFSNASFSFMVEGSTWQQQGPLSYIGLTKSDPFLKFIRNYAITLFKSGSMSQFIKAKSLKRKKKSNNSGDLKGNSSKEEENDANRTKFETPVSLHSELSPESLATKIQRFDKLGEPEIEIDVNLNTATHDTSEDTKCKVNKDIEEEDDEDVDEDEESDVIVEDGLIVSKIKVTQEDPKAKKSEEKSFRSLRVLPGLKSLYQRNKNKHEYFDLVGKVILEILPRKKNIFMLYCRFFKFVYPFIPILDENHFILDINHVLPEKFPQLSVDGRYELTEIKSSDDLVIFALLLLVIRLGYMSLIHNTELNNGLNEDEKSMLADMQRINSEEYSNVVNLCIPEEQTSQKSSFKLIQSLTLVHFYRLVTPDDCHGLGGTDSQILFGTIIKHAFAIGLNRDPTKYVAHENISKRQLLAKTWRSLWHYLVSVDAISAIHSGTVLNMQNLDISDVQNPEYDSKTGKIKEFFLNNKAIVESYRSLSNLISNVTAKPKVVDVLAETNKMEIMFFRIFGKDFFKDCICKPTKPPVNLQSPIESNIYSAEHEESYLKVMLYIAFVQLRTNLSCMYYKIGIFYENEYTESKTPSISAGIELFKIYIKSVIQLNYIMSYVVDNSVEVFGRNYDYILTAINERCMIKTHAFLTSFFIRLLHHKKVLSDKVRNENGEANARLKLEVIETLFKMVLVEAELYVGNFRKLSKKYINSYKIYVMTFFVLKQCMENPDVFFERSMKYTQFYHDGTNMIEFFTIVELQHLCKLCEEFRIAKDEQEKRKEASLSPDYAKTYPTPMNVMNSGKAFGSEYSDEASHTNSQTSSTIQPIEFDPSILNMIINSSGTDNPHMQDEDLLRLFEVYADVDPHEF